MAETLEQDLSGVADSLLLTLYLRAMESQRPDALSKDEKAVEPVTRMGHDFDRIRQIPMEEWNKDDHPPMAKKKSDAPAG